jgi:diacylglycerol kinase (ATP)
VKKKIAFIINPISGGISKANFPALVDKHINKNTFDFDMYYTQSKEHNKDLAKMCVAQQYDAIIAVGGDGTINNTAKYIAGTDICFGIIPVGSGNGLARHLGLSMNQEIALQAINKFDFIYIDTGFANNEFFINVAGVGFDAHVSWMFANAAKRGFWQYTKITLAEFAKYKTRKYQIEIDGKNISEDAFLVCIANGSQYGNNAYIAPTANINDGIFEVTILKPFKLHQMPQLGARIFNKTIHQSAQVKVLSGKQIFIKREAAEVVNIDGEPVMMDSNIDVKIIPSNLKIIVA